MDIDATKESSVDTRRFQAEDDSGHIIGSYQSTDSEQHIEELRKKDYEDKSQYNQWGLRKTSIGTETV